MINMLRSRSQLGHYRTNLLQAFANEFDAGFRKVTPSIAGRLVCGGFAVVLTLHWTRHWVVTPIGLFVAFWWSSWLQPLGLSLADHCRYKFVFGIVSGQWKLNNLVLPIPTVVKKNNYTLWFCLLCLLKISHPTKNIFLFIILFKTNNSYLGTYEIAIVTYVFFSLENPTADQSFPIGYWFYLSITENVTFISHAPVNEIILNCNLMGN